MKALGQDTKKINNHHPLHLRIGYELAQQPCSVMSHLVTLFGIIIIEPECKR